MCPSHFRCEVPRSLDEALKISQTHGDDAKVLAGGQSLIPLVKF